MSAHEDRIRSIQTSFQQATDQLISLLQQLDDATAMRAPADAWTPAQIGSHVAKTSEFLATAMAGGVHAAQIKVRKAGVRRMLLRPRASFVPELLKSVEAL